MNVLIVIYMIVSIILSLSTLTYVGVDIALEIRDERRKREEKPAIVFVPTPDPEVEPEPEVTLEIVDQIGADEVDDLLSDAAAMSTVLYESGAGHGKMGIVNIGEIDGAFEANETVTMALLKQRGLLQKSFGRVKILANGMLSKPLTVKAENYSVQAIKMIELTGGTVVILKD